MEFRHYGDADYESVCDFLIELNRDSREHIHWNWARLEWMIEHPEFDKSLKGAIGLWRDGERVVGAAISSAQSSQRATARPESSRSSRYAYSRIAG